MEFPQKVAIDKYVRKDKAVTAPHPKQVMHNWREHDPEKSTYRVDWKTNNCRVSESLRIIEMLRKGVASSATKCLYAGGILFLRAAFG
jgi:hypothetical protein